MKKVLIVGNHTCGNRGDAAILRGLLNTLKQLQPEIQLTVLSRFPDSSTFLLGFPCQKDKLHAFRQTIGKSLKAKILHKLQLRFIDKILVSETLWQIFSKFKFICHFKDTVAEIQTYDLVIQVGGSFFVDLYGAAQYDYALCTFLAKTPYIAAGHSLGPFETKKSRHLIRKLFKNANNIIVRENTSLQFLATELQNSTKLIRGADTAWLVDAPALQLKEKIIAITLRELAPFDRRLGINQYKFEQAFAVLIDRLVELGFCIKIYSTCTGIDGYAKDDRMVGLRVRQRCSQPAKIAVIMDELNDLELGEALSKATLTIGTRLHSAIISMNFGTPAFALNYEHKSAGILKQMGLPQMAVNIHDLFNDNLYNAIKYALNNLTKFEQDVKKAVIGEKELAKAAIEITLSELL